MLKTYPTGFKPGPSTIAVCDLNNDSRLDLAMAYENKDSIGIMLQCKTEPFATIFIFSSDNSSYPMSVAIDNFNSDGKSDIPVANSDAKNISIILANGEEIFATQQSYSSGDNSCPIPTAINHFNNNSHLDIVVVDSQTDSIIIFDGYGNRSIAMITTYWTGLSSNLPSITVQGLNKDNLLDIVVTNFNSNNVFVFLGSGSETF